MTMVWMNVLEILRTHKYAYVYTAMIIIECDEWRAWWNENKLVEEKWLTNTINYIRESIFKKVRRP